MLYDHTGKSTTKDMNKSWIDIDSGNEQDVYSFNTKQSNRSPKLIEIATSTASVLFSVLRRKSSLTLLVLAVSIIILLLYRVMTDNNSAPDENDLGIFDRRHLGLRFLSQNLQEFIKKVRQDGATAVTEFWY